MSKVRRIREISVFTSGGKFSVFTLSYVNTALNQSAFRIHKCYIINVFTKHLRRSNGPFPFYRNTSKSDDISLRKIQKYTNFQTSQDYIFHILQCFAIKLHNFTKFRMLFPPVLMNIPNSKVCLKGESAII